MRVGFGDRLSSRLSLGVLSCVALALALGAAGCADRTSLLVSVSSEDYEIPADIDRLDISVRGETTGMTIDRSFPLSAPWPHSLAVRPGMVESNMVRITVTAFHADEFVTRRVIYRAFTAGFEEVVEVPLQASCRNVMCTEGNDCQNGNCVGEMRDAGPPPDSGLDANIDGGVDANQDAPCPAGFSNCGGVCINRDENPMYCGADPACLTYDRCVGNETCISGVCTLDCEAGFVNCGGFCVNPQTDRSHCGASITDCSGGTECPAGEYCALGGCTSMCPPGLYLCFGNCIDPTSDRQYCGVGPDCTGGAGTCFAGQSCSSGNCVTTCPDGQYACGGRCIDPMLDRLYCGARSDCSGGSSCTGGEVCVGGTCSASCPSPQIACGGRCVDPDSDEGYCGANADCTGGDVCVAGFICRTGTCVANCPSGQVGCDGRCVDPLTDEAYCGASPTCTGAVTCGAREACTGGVCGCQPPERDCGGGCVDTRFDPTNCGMCDRACDPGEVCTGGTCAPLSGGGFTGGFGTTWTTLMFREVNCIQEFIPRASMDLYAGAGPNFGAWEIGDLTYRMAAAPPYTIPPNCALAYYGGGIFQVTPTDIVFYQPPSDEWRTAPLGMDLGPVGMSITDNDSLWTANSAFLLRGSPATSTVETISVGTTLVAPRVTYDQLTGRIYFASQGTAQMRSYDPVARSFRLEGMAPGNIGAGFCSDRAGHIYVGSQAEPRQLWQYSPASGRWQNLPMIPGFATGTTNCGVAEAGALYIAQSPGTELYRLPLERL
jgi:hypothetical protein